MDAIVKWLLANAPMVLPWCGYLVVSMVVVETFERLLVKERGGRRCYLLIYPRRLQSLFPILAGALMGIWLQPIDGRAWSGLYFASAGAVSPIAYDWLVAYAKSKGVTVNLPGSEDTIPPPPKDE